MTKRWHLPRVPKSANQTLRMHWSAQRHDQKMWTALVRSFCGLGPRSVGRVRLRITVVRVRKLDEDNLVGGLKPVIDALVRNGWLRDDSPRWVEWEVEQKTGWPAAKRGVWVDWEEV